jgi:hypothetical protein
MDDRAVRPYSVTIELSDETVRVLDRWRAGLAGVPTRREAVRQAVEVALGLRVPEAREDGV